MLISDFKTTLVALDHAIHQLRSHLMNAPDLFIAHPGQSFVSGKQAAEEAFSFLSKLYYEEGESDGRFTPVLLGGIALNNEGLHRVVLINEHKEQLAECVRRIKSSLKGRDGRTLSHAGSAKAFRSLMNEIGYGRLSIKQCTRKIPVLDRHVKSIRFSYSTGGKSLARKTPEQALRLLDKAGYTSVKSQIEREILVNMNPDAHLAQVQRLAGYYKANVLYANGVRKTVPTSMPLIYPYEPDQIPARQETLPSDQPGHSTRKRRRDQKVDDHPIIASIRVHAYSET